MLSIGRQGQLYVGEESSYGTAPSLLATMALRHRTITMPFDNLNQRSIVEKKQSPGTITAARTAGRKSASFTLEAILRPSAALNTLPEAAAVLKAAMGAVRNVTLSTTVTTGTGAVGGATLASGAGLAIGDALLITCPDGKKRVRWITAVNTGTGVTTWAPNLPAAPDNGAAVKAGICYQLTSALTLSLSLAHYLKKTDGTAGLARIIKGAVVDGLSLSFDANDDPMIKASGPGKEVVAAPSQPGSFTTVGGQPPSGITGELYLGNTAMKFLKMGVELKNGLYLRNEEYGENGATESFRKDRREITVSIDSRAEDEATLYDLAEAGTNAGVTQQTGFTEGNIVAVRLPAVEFKVPDTDDPDDLVNWNFKGMALESADAANDELYIAFL